MNINAIDIQCNPVAGSLFGKLHEPAWSWAALLVGALLCLSFIGLLHEPENSGAFGDQAAEAGRGIETDAKVEQNLVAMDVRRMYGLAGLTLVGVYCLLSVPHGVKRHLDAIWLLVALGLAWALASYAWSFDRRETLRELIRLFAFVGIGAAIARRFDPRALCHILLIVFCGSVMTAIGVEIAHGNFKPWVGGYRLAGSLHSNVLGRHAMIVCLLAFAFAKQHKASRNWWLLVIAMGAVVWMSGSRTSMVTTIVGLFAVHLLGRPMQETLGYLSCALTLTAIFLLGSIITGQWDSRAIEDAASMGRGGDVTSLAGRFPLWQAVWHDLGQRQLIGVGFGAFWTVHETESIASVLHWYPRHAHSAYLETIVNVGWIGLFFLVAAGLLAVRRADYLVRITNWGEYRVLGALLIAGFVNGIAEASFVLPRDLGLFVAAIGFSLMMFHPRLVIELAQHAPKRNGDEISLHKCGNSFERHRLRDIEGFHNPRAT